MPGTRRLMWRRRPGTEDRKVRATTGDGQPSGPPMFLRGWVFFLVVAVGVLAGAFLYVQKQPTVYTSSSVVTLTPKGTRPVSAGVVILTAPRYVAYATSPFALRQVANP